MKCSGFCAFLAASLIALRFISVRAEDYGGPNTGVEWQPIAFNSIGVVVEADTINPGNRMDIISCLASGVRDQSALVDAFTIRYSNDYVWFRYLNSSRKTVGYSKSFRRARDQEAGGELEWMDDSKGQGQSGYAENHAILKCRLAANGSVEIVVQNQYVARRFLGLLTTRGVLHGVYRFEKAYELR